MSQRTGLFQGIILAIFSIACCRLPAQNCDRSTVQLADQIVRTKLKFNPSHFLDVTRQEQLEKNLSIIAVRPTSPVCIYKVGESGDEVVSGLVVHHIVDDADPSFLVAVMPTTSVAFVISGLPDSSRQFNALISQLTLDIETVEQAQALAEFYQIINPVNEHLTPIHTMLQFKQAAELQCQMASFETGEARFESWWKRARLLYSKSSFKQAVASHEGGYYVEWIVLSSADSHLCGGAPLRARVLVGRNGVIGEPTFVPLRQRQH